MLISGRQISDEWFNRIKKLDVKNNLKHGKIYAYDGSVTNLKIKNNIVKAQVKGVEGQYFDVNIAFESLSNYNKKILKNELEANSKVFSNLLNNSFSSELLDFKVKILPSSLKEFKMTCNCGKKGLFCKHKAAVFHTIKKEIINNPFLIFSLRGFNISEIINSSHKIKKITDIFNRDTKEFEMDLNSSKHSIPFLLDNLNLVLKDNPSFFNTKKADFKEIFCEIITVMSDEIFEINNVFVEDEYFDYINLDVSGEYGSTEEKFEVKWKNPKTWKSITFNINSNYEATFKNENINYLLFPFLAELNHMDVEKYGRDIKFLHELFIFSSELIYSCALIPELIKLPNNKFHIRWIPAYDLNIQEKLNEFYVKCPGRLVTYNNQIISEDKQVLTVISLIFQGFTDYFKTNSLPVKYQSLLDDKYFKLFFNESVDLNLYPYRDMEYKISDWLYDLNRNKFDYRVILDIIQRKGKFKFIFKTKFQNKVMSLSRIDDNLKLKLKEVGFIENLLSQFNIKKFNFTLDLEGYNSFIKSAVPKLKSRGIEINIPDELKTVNYPRLLLDVDSSRSLSLNDLNKFNWKVAIGDESIPISDFIDLTSNFNGVIKFNNKFLSIDKYGLEEIFQQFKKIPKEMDEIELMHFILSNKNNNNFDIDSKIYDLLNHGFKDDVITVPEKLNGQLRHYQQIGYSWLVQNIKFGFGSILADDMGLGKTLQVLTAILYFKENGFLEGKSVLIIAPTSILTNWQKEIEKFTPSLSSFIYHGFRRHYPKKEYDIILTSYGMVRQDSEIFEDKKWFLLVLDEAQNIKNPKSKQTLSIKALNAEFRIALSGTPVENKLTEYWSIFDFINKGYLYSLKKFKNKFVKPINNNDKNVLENFKTITAPFILRRLKSDKNIIKDLPDKIINDVYCNLTLNQAALYDETLKALIRDVECSKGISRKGIILKLITSLKLICNHPALFLKSNNFTSGESGKMEVLMNILGNIIDSGEKVLIFTQYVKMGNIIKKCVENEFNTDVSFLHGGISRANRDRMVSEFQNGDIQVFILSLKAGGTGLNLTAAQNVIHYDLWWNPAVENQATDRAYRIGQNKNVMVYRFITTGTLEENVNNILFEKQKLLEMAVEGKEIFITEMSDDELKNMLRLRS